MQRKLSSNTKYMQLDLSISYQKRKNISILYEVKKSFIFHKLKINYCIFLNNFKFRSYTILELSSVL